MKASHGLNSFRGIPLANGAPNPGRVTHKWRGAGVIPKPNTGNNEYEVWKNLYVTDWDWDGWIEPQLELCLRAGANLVKLPTHINAYFSTHADYQYKALVTERHNEMIQWCADHNMAWMSMLQVNPWGGQAGTADYRAGIAEYAHIVDQFPNVIGFDYLNEINLYVSPSGAVAMAELMLPEIRAAAPTLPVTCSLNGPPNNASGTHPPMYWDSLAPFVDWQTFNFYGAQLLNSHFDLYRAESHFRPFSVTELGAALNVTPNYPQLEQLIQDAAPIWAANDCLGGLIWPIHQYVGPGGDGYSGLYRDLIGSEGADPGMSPGNRPIDRFRELQVGWLPQ